MELSVDGLELWVAKEILGEIRNISRRISAIDAGRHLVSFGEQQHTREKIPVQFWESELCKWAK